MKAILTGGLLLLGACGGAPFSVESADPTVPTPTAASAASSAPTPATSAAPSASASAPDSGPAPIGTALVPAPTSSSTPPPAPAPDAGPTLGNTSSLSDDAGTPAPAPDAGTPTPAQDAGTLAPVVPDAGASDDGGLPPCDVYGMPAPTFTHHSGFGQTWVDYTDPSNWTTCQDNMLNADPTNMTDEMLKACNLATSDEPPQPGYPAGVTCYIGAANTCGPMAMDWQGRYIWYPGGFVFAQATFDCGTNTGPSNTGPSIATWN